MSSLLLLEYNEDQWKRYSEAEQQECYDTWIKKYLPVTDYHGIVLKLKPDPIFPSGEHEYPYVYWRYDLTKDRKPKKDFEISCHVYIDLDQSVTDIDPRLRAKIELAVREYPNGTTWQVSNGTKELLRGKVNK